MQQSMFYRLAKFVDSYHIIAYYVINWHILTFLLVWLDSSISYNQWRSHGRAKGAVAPPTDSKLHNFIIKNSNRGLINVVGFGLSPVADSGGE